jgi:hypothetical protein
VLATVRDTASSNYTQALEKMDGAVFEWMQEEWRGGHEIKEWILQQDVIPADLAMYGRYWKEQLGLSDRAECSVASGRPTDVGVCIVVDIQSYLRGLDE